MLTVGQRTQLDTTGVARIPGVVDRAAVERMADAVWASLAARGIDRARSETWPTGFLGKHQSLRRARVFDAFATELTTAIVDDLLGAGTWHAGDAWGPALVTFPEPGPWTVPQKIWHFDLPGRGDPDRPNVVRLFGYVTDVVALGGGTVVVEGSHELVRRMVAASADHDAGNSAELRRKLIAAHPWFRALCREGGDGGDRIQQLMTDGDEIDGVRVRVVELTARVGDMVVMLPWTLHNLSMNCADAPRFMVTHTLHRIAQPASATPSS